MALGLAAPLTLDEARIAYAKTAERLSDDRILLGAFDDGALVGAVQLARPDAGNGRHRAEVQRLVVRSDRRGQGVGRALMEAVVEAGRERGLKLLWLMTHAGTDADRVYERLGWSRVGVIPDYAELPNGELAANAFYYLRL
jgi:GNAT superfamily N-acetyltransferase